MTHELLTDENFDIVRGNQTVRVPFAATDPQTAETKTLATEDEIAAKQDALSQQQLDNIAAVPDKLDASSASAPFSSDQLVSYDVGDHCTYNGKLYVCLSATTGGTWNESEWEVDTMTDPDAVLDVTTNDQLRVIKKDGTVLWAQGYGLATSSSTALSCDAVNNFKFDDGMTTQEFQLPDVQLSPRSGKVCDLVLDIDNSENTSAATITLPGLDTDFSVVVPEGENLSDMLSIAAGELSRFYITLSTFKVNDHPTWHIVKQVVENGGAAS